MSEELDRLIEEKKREEAFLAAKEDVLANPTGKAAQARWRKAKDEMRAWRQQQREGREPGAGTAAPATVGLKAKASL